MNKYVEIFLTNDDSIEGVIVSSEDNGIIVNDEDEESHYNYFIPHESILYIEYVTDVDAKTNYTVKPIKVSPATKMALDRKRLNWDSDKDDTRLGDFLY